MRRPPATEPPASRAVELDLATLAILFVVAVALAAVASLPQWPAVLGGSLFNPDTYMRLVRIDDMLAAHARLDAVARDGGGGTVLAWSHLYDLVLLSLAAPLRPVMSERDALYWAVAFAGPLSTGALACAIAWSVGPLCARAWWWLPALATPLSRPIATYGMAGSATHHVLLVATVAMVAGWSGRVGHLGGRAGFQAGVWAGLGAWLSPETVPLSLACLGAIALQRVRMPQRQLALAGAAAACTGFAVVVIIACVVDPPRRGIFTIAVDRVSIVYAALGLLLLAATSAALVLDRIARPGWLRVLAPGAVLALGLGLLLQVFPQLMRGTAALMSPDNATIFFGEIGEMQPVQDVAAASALLLTGILGVAVFALKAITERSLLWAYATACTVAVLCLAAVHRRFAIYSAGIGAAALPLAMTLVSRRPWALPTRVAAGVAVAVLFDLGLRMPDPLGGFGRSAAPPLCDLRHVETLLGPFAGQVVLASPGETPEILYRTAARTVGSLYHRNVAAYLRLRDAWRAEWPDGSAEVPPPLRAARIDLILACPLRRRLGMLADLPRDTLYDRLDRMDVPRWLQIVGSDPASGLVLFQVIEPKDAAGAG